MTSQEQNTIEQCGFSSVSFFIRSFNRVNGCSPLKWRQFH